MKPGKKKDALTDLVDVASQPDSCNSNQNVSEGQAVTSSGEVVTLGIDADILRDIDALAQKITKDLKKNR
jgi:ribosome-associated translation inhibitor RaiA